MASALAIPLVVVGLCAVATAISMFSATVVHLAAASLPDWSSGAALALLGPLALCSPLWLASRNPWR